MNESIDTQDVFISGDVLVFATAAPYFVLRETTGLVRWNGREKEIVKDQRVGEGRKAAPSTMD
jgi:hypothetical protein